MPLVKNKDLNIFEKTYIPQIIKGNFCKDPIAYLETDDEECLQYRRLQG